MCRKRICERIAYWPCCLLLLNFYEHVRFYCCRIHSSFILHGVFSSFFPVGVPGCRFCSVFVCPHSDPFSLYPTFGSDQGSSFVAGMMKSLRRDAAGRGRQRKDRSAFWVAPPQRYVINRHGPRAVPHSLSVVVVVDPHMVEPTAFLQPIAPLANDKRNCGAAENGDAISAEPDSASDQVVPSFFRLDVYVWDDTTLREIVEEVLASSAAARQVLLPSDAPAAAAAEVVGGASKPPASTGAEKAEKRGGHDGGGDDGGNGNSKDDGDDGASVELDDGNDSVGGDAADEEPASKRERTEGEKKQRDETRMGAPSAAKRALPSD
ncbi:hypothetical protein MOQ_008058, partial [Trypanosoma cruzi marinkellei]